jgi:hypothetical protein
MHHPFADSKPARKSHLFLGGLSTQDEQKEATAHVDLHDEPAGLHPPLKTTDKRKRSTIIL